MSHGGHVSAAQTVDHIDELGTLLQIIAAQLRVSAKIGPPQLLKPSDLSMTATALQWDSACCQFLRRERAEYPELNQADLLALGPKLIYRSA